KSLAGLGLMFGAVAIVTANDPAHHWSDMIWNVVTLSIAWIVGYAVGEKFREVDEAKARAARAEREREERARRAVADERARIARELHDVVGHSVSVMPVQASAVRRRLEQDQERVSEALMVVEQTGGAALARMRRGGCGGWPACCVTPRELRHWRPSRASSSSSGWSSTRARRGCRSSCGSRATRCGCRPGST